MKFTPEQVIEMARGAGFDTRRESVLVDGLDISRTITRLCALAADRALEARYPAGFEPVEFLVGEAMWVKAAYQRGGARKWKIARGFDEVLNKQGQWEDEPIPSSRTDDFLARCRFDSLEECAAAIRAMKEQA